MQEVSSDALMAPLVDGSMGSHTVAVMCAFAPISRGALMRVAGASRPRVVRWWHALPLSVLAWVPVMRCCRCFRVIPSCTR